MPVLMDFLKEIETDGGDLHRQFQTCKSLVRQLKAYRVVDSATTSSFGNRMPTREQADQLVEAYLRTFETVYRTIHVPSFRADYERYWAAPNAADGSFIILLQLCMAIGAAFEDDTFPLRSSASHWVLEANLWLTLACKGDKTSITGIQILCLTSCMTEVRSILQSWYELCRERLGAGGTNVKALVSAACMVAHVNGLEARWSKSESEKMLREAAGKGAAECIEILRAIVRENSETSEAEPLDNTYQNVNLNDIGDFDFLGT